MSLLAHRAEPLLPDAWFCIVWRRVESKSAALGVQFYNISGFLLTQIKQVKTVKQLGPLCNISGFLSVQMEQAKTVKRHGNNKQKKRRRVSIDQMPGFVSREEEEEEEEEEDEDEDEEDEEGIRRTIRRST